MLEIKDLHASVNGKEILKGINLSIKKGDRPGLVYHLDYYLKSDINVEPYTRHVRTVQWENKLSNLFLYPINEIEV